MLPYIRHMANWRFLTHWAPSVRELSAKLTEGESLPLPEASNRMRLSPPPAYAGAPSQRGPKRLYSFFAPTSSTLPDCYIYF